jgi:hypothetical protein
MIEDETGEDMYDSSDDSDDGWFKNDCGESYDNGTRAGPIRMMLRSLIAQLLCDYDYNMRTELPPHVDSFLLEQGNIEQLSLVLVWLIRQLPWDVTLFCLVDGIVFYEREEFENPMLDAMGPILGLAADEYVSATVKVLVTSPWPTSTVRLAFEPEADGDEAKSWVLSMQTLPQMYLSPTDERMVRELSTMEEYLK